MQRHTEQAEITETGLQLETPTKQVNLDLICSSDTLKRNTPRVEKEARNNDDAQVWKKPPSGGRGCKLFQP